MAARAMHKLINLTAKENLNLTIMVLLSKRVEKKVPRMLSPSWKRQILSPCANSNTCVGDTIHLGNCMSI
jgi:hypothetical protein